MRLKYTLPQKAMECVSGAALVFAPVYLAIKWNEIPDTIPTHYGITGVADAWGDKGTIVVVPVACAVLYALVTVLSLLPVVWNTPVALTDENRERVLGTLLSMLCAIKLTITLFFAHIAMAMASVAPLGVLATATFLISVFAVIIIYVILAMKRGKAG